MGTELRTVAFVGSRKYKSQEKVKERFHQELEKGPFRLVSGGAEGPDSFAKALADIAGVPSRVYKPGRPNFAPDGQYVITQIDTDEMGNVTTKKLPKKFPSFGKAAHYRNGLIVEDAEDGVVAFWDGESTGTKGALDKAEALGRNVEIVGP